MAQPALVVTGAAGFIGRHLLESLREEGRVFAIDRRPQPQGMAHSSVTWLRVDVADREPLADAFRAIASAGGAGWLVHLAAHYDFTGQDHPEYERTNVQGTRLVLEAARGIRIPQIVFASSLAACAFPAAGHSVTESAPANGEHAYARSKRLGEGLVRESPATHAVIARLAAVFSDWCEFPPLFTLLDAWLGRSWRRSLLAGRGRSGVPYVHVQDVVGFLRRVLERLPDLDHGEVLLASPAGDTTHAELFAAATRASGRARRPILVPVPVCLAGVCLRDALGRLLGRRPFERPWMVRYVDQRLRVDSSRTRARLAWAAGDAHRVERRLPVLIENQRANPRLWAALNQEMLRRPAAVPRDADEPCVPGG